MSLKIIELRHQELRAEADRARRAVGARRTPFHRTLIASFRSLAGRRRSSRRASVQPAR